MATQQETLDDYIHEAMFYQDVLQEMLDAFTKIEDTPEEWVDAIEYSYRCVRSNKENLEHVQNVVNTMARRIIKDSNEPK